VDRAEAPGTLTFAHLRRGLVDSWQHEQDQHQRGNDHVQRPEQTEHQGNQVAVTVRPEAVVAAAGLRRANDRKYP